MIFQHNKKYFVTEKWIGIINKKNYASNCVTFNSLLNFKKSIKIFNVWASNVFIMRGYICKIPVPCAASAYIRYPLALPKSANRAPWCVAVQPWKTKHYVQLNDLEHGIEILYVVRWLKFYQWSWPLKLSVSRWYVSNWGLTTKNAK